MAKTIRVTPESLNQMANNVTNWTIQYRGIYDAIYNQIEVMTRTWSGEANQAYTAQINGFRDDFEALRDLLQRYSEFIQNTANQYSTTEQAIADAAKNLSTGN